LILSTNFNLPIEEMRFPPHKSSFYDSPQNLTMPGNQVAIEGKKEMRIRKMAIIIRKGTTALDTSAALLFATLCKMNKLIPSGGEINANSILITIMTANQRGSNPSLTMRGYNIGRVITKIEMASRGAPKMIKKMLMQIIINQGGRLKDKMYSIEFWAICVIAVS
jgi:hypothetical protein